MPILTNGYGAAAGAPGQVLNTFTGNGTNSGSNNPSSVTFTATTTAVDVWVSTTYVSSTAGTATVTVNGASVTIAVPTATSQAFTNTVAIPFRGLIPGASYTWTISSFSPGGTLIINSVVVESA